MKWETKHYKLGSSSFKWPLGWLSYKMINLFENWSTNLPRQSKFSEETPDLKRKLNNWKGALRLINKFKNKLWSGMLLPKMLLLLSIKRLSNTKGKIQKFKNKKRKRKFQTNKNNWKINRQPLKYKGNRKIKSKKWRNHWNINHKNRIQFRL